MRVNTRLAEPALSPGRSRSPHRPRGRSSQGLTRGAVHLRSNTRFVLTAGAADGATPEIASARIASGAYAPTAVLATAVSTANITVNHLLRSPTSANGLGHPTWSRRAPRHRDRQTHHTLSLRLDRLPHQVPYSAPPHPRHQATSASPTAASTEKRITRPSIVTGRNLRSGISKPLARVASATMGGIPVVAPARLKIK